MVKNTKEETCAVFEFCVFAHSVQCGRRFFFSFLVFFGGTTLEKKRTNIRVLDFDSLDELFSKKALSI